MTPKKFTTLEVKSEDMPADFFYDLLDGNLGHGITIDYPDSKEIIQISNIPVEEVEKVINTVRNGGGEIIEK
jgi:hypothetical protein